MRRWAALVVMLASVACGAYVGAAAAAQSDTGADAPPSADAPAYGPMPSESDRPERDPALADLSGLEPLPVARIADDGRIVVLERGRERTIILAGVGPAKWDDRSTADALKDLLIGESVCLLPAGDFDPRGEDGPRMVARAPEGLVINLELVRQGAAKVAQRTPREFAPHFYAAQQRAQAAKRGVWNGRPTRPRRITPGEGSAPEEATPAERRDARAPDTRGAPAPPGAAPSQPAEGATTVYVTASGKKYHANGCRHLSKSSRAIALADARKTHEPCASCSPPR